MLARALAPFAVCGVVGCVVYSTTPRVETVPPAESEPARDRVAPAEPPLVAASSPAPAAGGEMGTGAGRPYGPRVRPAPPRPSAAAGPAPLRVLRAYTFSIDAGSRKPAHDVPRSSPAPAYGAPAWSATGRSSPSPAWLFGADSPDPAWSPDGARIAVFDGACVSIRSADGRLEKRLLATAVEASFRDGACRSPRWSHDGRRIVAGHAFHGPGILFDVASGRGAAIRPRGDEGIWGLSFTPDDRYVVGRIHQTGVALVPVGRLDTAYALATTDAPVMRGYFPSVAPDGRHAAWLEADYGGSGGGGPAVHLARVDLSAPPRGRVPDPWTFKGPGYYDAVLGMTIASIPMSGPAMDLTWSPDGASLLVVESHWYGGYDSYAYPDGMLQVIAASSGAMHALDVAGRNPSWSPDGRYIVFDRSAGGIWLTTGSGEGPWLLWPTGVEPRWSPDGGKILVQDERERALIVLTVSP